MKVTKYHITDKKAIDNIKKIIAQKDYIQSKVREGKFSEVKSQIKFAKSL